MIDFGASPGGGAGKPQVGLLLAFLGPTASSELLDGLPERDAGLAVRSLLELRDEDLADQAGALDGVYQALVARELLASQGPLAARQALESEVGEERACELLETLSKSCGRIDPSGDGSAVDLDGDAPRLALALAFLPRALALRTLRELPVERQVEVLGAMADLAVHHEGFFVNEAEAADGVDFVVRLLAGLDDGESEFLMAALAEGDPELAAEIRFRAFLFEDLLFLEEYELRRVLEAATIEDLTLALSAASAALKDRVFDCLSPGAREALRRDLGALGPIRLGDVEAAQRTVLAGLQLLERRAR